MNRRGFLKSIGVGLVTISGLGAVKTKKPDYAGEIHVENIKPFEFNCFNEKNFDNHETHKKAYSDWWHRNRQPETGEITMTVNVADKDYYYYKLFVYDGKKWVDVPCSYKKPKKCESR